MTPDPDIGATWLTVSDFIDRVALDSAQTEFPVIGPRGSLAEVTGVRRLWVGPSCWLLCVRHVRW